MGRQARGQVSSRAIVKDVVEQRWASVKEAAIYSGLSERQIEILAASGEVISACPKRRGAKRGRRLIDLRSLDRWIENGIGQKSELPELQAAAARHRKEGA